MSSMYVILAMIIVALTIFAIFFFLVLSSLDRVKKFFIKDIDKK